MSKVFLNMWKALDGIKTCCGRKDNTYFVQLRLRSHPSCKQRNIVDGFIEDQRRFNNHNTIQKAVLSDDPHSCKAAAILLGGTPTTTMPQLKITANWLCKNAWLKAANQSHASKSKPQLKIKMQPLFRQWSGQHNGYFVNSWSGAIRRWWAS